MDKIVNSKMLANIPDVILDGDGIPIHKGDTVYIDRHWESPYVVDGFCISRSFSLEDLSPLCDDVLEVKLKEAEFNYGLKWLPNDLYHKPNEKSILTGLN